jgi:hypothetical protein
VDSLDVARSLVKDIRRILKKNSLKKDVDVHTLNSMQRTVQPLLFAKLERLTPSREKFSQWLKEEPRSSGDTLKIREAIQNISSQEKAYEEWSTALVRKVIETEADRTLDASGAVPTHELRKFTGYGLDFSIHEWLEEFKEKFVSISKSSEKANVLYWHGLSRDLQIEFAFVKTDYEGLKAALVKRYGSARKILESQLESFGRIVVNSLDMQGVVRFLKEIESKLIQTHRMVDNRPADRNLHAIFYRLKTMKALSDLLMKVENIRGSERLRTR